MFRNKVRIEKELLKMSQHNIQEILMRKTKSPDFILLPEKKRSGAFLEGEILTFYKSQDRYEYILFVPCGSLDRFLH